jgi:hypothetical protein
MRAYFEEVSLPVAFEIDEFIQHVNMRGRAVYHKGVVVTAHEPRLIDFLSLWWDTPIRT